MSKTYYKSLVAAAIISSFTQTAIADTLAPIAADQDTWTNGSGAGSGTNYGTQTTVRIDTGKMRAFMQFTVTGIPDGHVVDTAILTLTAQGNKSGNIPDTFVAAVTNAPVWDQTTLTDLNDDDLLAATGDAIATATDIAVGSTADFDIAAGIESNGTYTFMINISDADARATKYYSSEASEEFRPTLTITTKPGEDTDTTAPEFSADIPAIEINATGTNTDISSLINITAIDDTDGEVPATVVSNTSLTSGTHTVMLEATDAAGNTSDAKAVTVNITPLVVLTSPETLELPPGETASASIALSGPAVSYPASIGYSIAGEATSDTSGTLTFTAENYADKQSVNITLAGDAQSTQTAVLTLTEADNVQASNDTVTVTTFDGNLPPSLTLTLTQGNVTIATINAGNAVAIPSIDAAKGDVTVTLDIFDFNGEDLHSVTWPETSDDLGAAAEEFVFSPTGLSGDYALNVNAVEDNTTEKYATLLAAKIRIIAEDFPELVAGDDTDNDGILDIDEGFDDSDGDGIVDYLDGNPDTTQLPLAADQKPLQTLDTLTLSLGSVAGAQGLAADSAIITAEDLATSYSGLDTSDSGFLPIVGASLFNFTVNGVADGGTAPIVYPLPKDIIITKEAEYRKYTPTNGWVTFVSDEHNTIASAAKDGNGNCPAPNDALYDHGLGLQENDSCIQLTIKDGGIYDADDTENGIIEDPGVLAETYTAVLWSTDAIQLPTTMVNEGSNVILTADLTTHVGDADISTLTFAKDEGPTWLTVDEAGELSADVSKVASGDYSATVSFIDNKAQTAQTEVKVSVAFNNAPKFAAVELAPAARNVAYTATIAPAISDAESDAYTVEKVSGPYWLEVSEAGILSGTPLKANIGDNNITVKLTDAKGASTEATFNVLVADSSVRASDGGSFSAGLITLLGLLSLGRKKAKK